MNNEIATVLVVAIGFASPIESAWSGDGDIVLTPDKVQLADVPSYPGMKAATLMGNFAKWRGCCANR